MPKKKPKIKDLPVLDRPREKLQKKRAENLRDSELLAILLRTGYQDKNAIDLAKHLLRKYKVKELLNLGFKDLIKLKGIGTAKAATVKAAFELSNRALRTGKEEGVIINTAKDAFKQVADLSDKKQEHLVALYLNAMNKLITKETVTIGTLKANLISPREIFSKALDKPTTSVILAHNHPSGDKNPSTEDIEITKKLVEAGRIMDVSVFDHIVVSNDSFVSIKKKMPEIFK